MYVGALTLDVLLGDVRSLKQKRSAVRPLVADIHRRYPAAAVAETGHLELHRRAEIGVAVVSSTAANALSVLAECERLVAMRPEIELLSAKQRLFNEEDLWTPPGRVSSPTRSSRSSPRCWNAGSRTRGSGS